MISGCYTFSAGLVLCFINMVTHSVVHEIPRLRVAPLVVPQADPPVADNDKDYIVIPSEVEGSPFSKQYVVIFMQSST